MTKSRHTGYMFHKKYWSLYIFFLTYHLEVSDSSKNDDVESNLEMGRMLLMKGQYADALSHLHAAVDRDPKNSLAYFRRATVYLALGKPKAALDDLNEVISLKSEFLPARLQRANVLLKLGRLDEAHLDLEWVLRIDPYNEEALHLYTSIEPLKHDIKTVYMLMEDHDWMTSIEITTKLLQELVWDVKLREMRATCYEKLGDIINAISDLRATTKMRADNTEGYLKLSKLHYNIGEADESLITIRECLKLDPDHKICFKHYKKVKKLANQMKQMNEFSQANDFEACIERANAALKTEPNVPRIVHLIKSKECHCHNKNGDASEAIKVCTEALKYDGEDVNVFCDRGEAYLQNEDHENAQSDFHHAVNIDESLKRAQDGLRKAQKLVKLGKSRDYYKILGVKRNASKREITKAYRKMAQKWHPDNFKGDEKKAAEKKFIDIAAAKEVLTDPEKREKFDNGEDPLDAEAQQGNPWANAHFHPFSSQSGPFTFRFHFN